MKITEVFPGEAEFVTTGSPQTSALATVEALLTATNGDFQAFCEVLSSNALKHGAARKVLPEEVYSQFFVTEVAEDLKEGGTKKKLQKFDERFLPTPAAAPTGS